MATDPAEPKIKCTQPELEGDRGARSGHTSGQVSGRYPVLLFTSSCPPGTIRT